jgi:hypothetical protein
MKTLFMPVKVKIMIIGFSPQNSSAIFTAIASAIEKAPGERSRPSPEEGAQGRFSPA